MNNTLDCAIRDVAPDLSGAIPAELKQLTSRLYASSRQKIPLRQQQELARHHLCAIVAVTKLSSRLNLTPASVSNVPLPPKLINELVTTFMTKLDGLGSSSNTPISTPSKARIVDLDTATTPMLQSPSLRASQLADQSPTPTPTTTPSPVKRGKGRPPGSKNKSKFMKNLEKRMPSLLQSDPGSPSTTSKVTESLRDVAGTSIDTERHLLLLTTREIVVLCNKFQLDSTLANNVLETYHKYCYKVANEWILICGLILNCYLVVNNKLLAAVVGSKTNAIKTMFNLQKGGLMLSDVKQSIEITRPLVDHLRWFKCLKKEHDAHDTSSINIGGNMLHNYKFSSEELLHDQEEWLNHILNSA
ncbi:unnamed protein product [Cyberlindnera jadinii]|uniref:ORC6 first cyclin-like domain-containing protein n=1 Tax=Cyberlindnera jadinii (strain ATCC 18201 / CBS 1600 / BCRC 20928 / JCM 3617 / NBRC 0987 / NRRL Y-1542) TaxID=983966 RepID=A0A0H5C6H1_CYBJN|nr:hypothetical protein CYBJADRAFT_169039 [Cyberlindnera jadinii NRRL Y-1542]ODV72023.1 hypothetical protein CYBJADRAFT_169039 [Cyberlindnera jadinii NRRL Y-1542]CEP23681.1 unnamed protein product [Cyberlindnera jadinii]